ncbi:hypothetical protein GCM10007939_01970 [Amylibacter marinus]|uniref:TadE-like domain-containing protein n=1 Tax=Amylibacter marinus TaxID=1475483 RepID=A0ABQ5VRN5_9RHOB|nr:TadE/TadG family type IV pilus assembly protein [Amylibacter marinus]GLQ33914.1 hypothetical protein GCM10007939_01970 [Amylibacter marinus]
MLAFKKWRYLLRDASLFKRFSEDQRGATSLEMVVASTLFLFILFWMIETGFIMLRWIMLERGVDIAARELRLYGVPEAYDTNLAKHEYIKTKICDETAMIKDCDENLYLELRPVDSSTGIPNTAAQCVDRTDDIDPNLGIPTVDAGARNVADARDIMFMRACVVVDPILPANYSMPLKLDPSGGIALVVDSAYINEPN